MSEVVRQEESDGWQLEENSYNQHGACASITKIVVYKLT
jgi:hypothetical protein